MSAKKDGMQKMRQGRSMDSGETMQEDAEIQTDIQADLQAALRHFRLSMHAWSDAAYSRPRAVALPTRSTIWRKAAGWALGCVLVLGVASEGVYQHEQHMAQEQQAKLARQIELERQAEAQKAADEDALLAHVDSDVSREVPAALDPLASLVEGDESK
jgi:hypothetical protein